MAHIRTHEELMRLKPTAAEKLLIQHAKAGTVCVLKDGNLPDEEKTIRAEVLRYLILGGCDACEVDQKVCGWLADISAERWTCHFTA